ncbi:MAG: sigma-70 family RNA polymerase sigma factor [Candidatus Longimicrobiales bacterium M2_2A_002]
MTDPKTVTQLLHAWRQGDENAPDRLVPLIYDELKRLAGRAMRGERPDHTLQPTALVHEAFARLVDADIDWNDRIHFLATAATVMRRVLVDHARAKSRQKRGGDAVKVTLEEALVPDSEPSELVLALDEALNRLAEVDERKSRVVELHYFGGLTHPEVAAALEISPATVDRDLRMARAWLHRELN